MPICYACMADGNPQADCVAMLDPCILSNGCGNLPRVVDAMAASLWIGLAAPELQSTVWSVGMPDARVACIGLSRER